ncbi:MAG TPA: glycosyltransferase family 4 protein [Candidatus Eisenbacteria bacterium]|nr:glycosyltransferase family 4 protein [Candidatus Eisenbacteria bacterium]
MADVRVLIAGVNYRPEQTGIGPYTAGLAEHLAGRGHQVVVSTTFPHYPHWTWQRDGCAPDARLNGVQVRRRRVILPRRRSAGWRVLYDSSFAIAVLRSGLGGRRPDLVLCVSPPVQAALAGAILVRSWRERVPLLLLVKDLPLQAALSVGMMRPGATYRAGEWLERRAYALADRIVVINERFERRLLGQGVPRGKVVVIPDWADLERSRPRPPEPDMRRLLGGGDGEFVVLHAGSMGEKQSLGTAVLAARLAGRDARVRLALVGDGSQRRVLERLAKEDGEAPVRLLPLQPEAEFPRLLAAADALLLHQRADVVDSVAPSKLLSYMAAGRPVLAAVSPDSVAADLVRRAGCGVIVRPEDPPALAAAMQGLGSDAEGRDRMGARGRRFVERNFERGSILARWEALVSGRMEPRPGADPAAPEEWTDGRTDEDGRGPGARGG